MEKQLTIIKNSYDKRVTLMIRNLEAYGSFRHKTSFHLFFLSTYYPVNGEKG